MKGPELNYGISDIECLACVFLVKKWHHYLYGAHFTLYTDHKALLQLMGLKDYLGRLGRQAMFLQEYNFTIKYLPGEENSAADISSRPAKFALAVSTRSSNQREELINHQDLSYKSDRIDIYEDQPLVHFLMHGKHSNGLSKNQVNRVNRMKDNYKIVDCTIHVLKNKIWKEIPIKAVRKEAIERAHLKGHFSIDTTLERIENTY